ncbi:MAG: Type 4 prepilin-like proteins leader peptide-processing enzyme [Syntrophus sp. PtaU1.Bin005]|jgi:leader peptidase (prepilin peptidase)/N-methyltransferase|nr:MAG: Type 4 prepilin-like proteins leader peptide-processing enzyme [Syntrophus sp. PtaB.Bin138]OPY81048.1 MAG: Type 4 prepilin-like proteins leader peptide-processing enzyme [Syntrophus sp. PtaU1.Bin005]
MTDLAGIVVFVLGAVVGSFLNVCIWRIPQGLSIVFPASSCPRCGHSIRFYDNIPLVSYLLLRGRCRSCGERISLRYPIVEGLTALMALLLFWKFGLTLKFAAAFLFVSALILVAFIDIDHQIIPDVISLPGIPICFLLSVFLMELPFMEALLGLVLGGGSLYLIAVLYELATKREGMGGGDIKLLAMMGAFLGWKSLLFILLVSSLAGAVVGISVMWAKGGDMKYAVPFGPFLSIAATAYLFVGDYAVNLLLYHQI